MTQTLSILLVDAHPVVRVGARSLLEAEPGMYVADEAESGENACRKYIDRPADVVVIDLDLPGIGGLEAIRRIKSRHHEARILVFTGHHETVFVEQSLQAGARGYLGKHCAGAAAPTAGPGWPCGIPGDTQLKNWWAAQHWHMGSRGDRS